jgi:hypothetical protein
MKKDQSLEDSFLQAFGQNSDVPKSPYSYRDQKDVVRDYNKNLEKPTEISEIHRNELEDHTQIGTSKETGEKFEINVKSFKPKNDQEKEWIDREMMVSFTSLDDRDKKIVSTLTGLCNGKYASYKSLPVQEVVGYLSNECDFIFGYADASLAIYSDVIEAKQAFRIARSISENNIISGIDYDKIRAKLPTVIASEFDGMLADARMKIAYPIESVVKTSSVDNSNVDYYFSYIKDLKEYKLGDTDGLRQRVASIVSQSDEDTRVGLIMKMKKDSILKNII